jgi:hypothetical protein
MFWGIEIYLNDLCLDKDMNFKQFFTKKRIIFVALFFVLVLIGKNINFSPVIGAENQFFTLYQFFGPTAGAFLGPIFGGIAVLFAQIADFLILGKEFSLIALLRMLPMIFAVIYFANRKKFVGAIVPLLCMVLFIVHPIGKQVWIFSLYWLIPILGSLFPRRFLLLKSLGATFTAHAIGSVLWLYTVPMEAGQWLALIPTVAYERLIFACGIAVSYVFINTVLDYAVEKFKINLPFKEVILSKKYSLLRILN